MPESLKDTLEKLADKDGRSLNRYVERILQRHVKETETEKHGPERKTAEIPFLMR